ncbi:hypothetical protein BDN72DRAFT_766659 [Pluteus cervinus]|uniref:Uncharacterized protein n=1 Tax=Pluteus cervinus TaxID=181527 RepID=A0ACD3AX94_9AGAR|nr:hypothetical protein BDN72DRAFT_766659 [Pluteus cervinus]
MRRELDVTKTELSRSQIEVSKLQERCRMLERTLRETKDLLLIREAEVERLRKEKERDRRRSSELQQQAQELARAARQIRSRHSQASIRTASTTHTNGTQHTRRSSDSMTRSSTVSEEDHARIRSNELYMTRADSWSGAQVLQAVHDLNAEILQFAAAATDLCTFDKDSRPTSSRSIQAMHDTSARLGPNLSRILSNRDHSQDPILVQLAIQGCIATCISRALSSFCMGYPSKSDAIISQIYAHMRLAEPQPTSSRWRALAHKHIHTLYPTLTDYATGDLAETIFRWSSDIFIIAGCSSYDSASPRDSLRGRFGDQVRRISKSVIRLAQVSREEIMSTCFEIVSVDHGEAYDPSVMADAFQDYVSPRGGILATTELGLRCTTRKGSETQDEDDISLEQRILLQPKVVLESVLDVLDPR